MTSLNFAASLKADKNSQRHTGIHVRKSDISKNKRTRDSVCKELLLYRVRRIQREKNTTHTFSVLKIYCRFAETASREVLKDIVVRAAVN